MHPLYHDDGKVREQTEAVLAQGHTVFQLYQFPGGEQQHSLRVLEQLNLPLGAKVLSMGCGVAGMEKYWHDARPDLLFSLLNSSYSQMGLCLCPGLRVVADAQDYQTDERFDLVVFAYVLGHLDVSKAIYNALGLLTETGHILILDVFNGSPHFDEAFAYSSPKMPGVKPTEGLEVGDAALGLRFVDECTPVMRVV